MAYDISPQSRHSARSPAAYPPVVEGSASENPQAQFTTLDGRNVIVLGRRWRIEVYSIWEMEWCRYVQLALQGDPTYMVTIQLTGGQGVRDVVSAVIRWLTHPSSSGALIRVG